MLRSPLVGLLVGLLLTAPLLDDSEAAKRCNRTCQCRRTCTEAMAACASRGRKAKKCRKQVMKTCKRRGVRTCQGPSIIPTTTATLPGVRYTVTDLGTLASGSGTAKAYDLDNHGRVVGESLAVTGRKVAFLYSDGRMQPLSAPLDGPSVATAINDAGQIVGKSEMERGLDRTVFLYANGVMQDIVPRATSGFCTRFADAPSINNAGQVVGIFEPSDPPCPLTLDRRGFLYGSGVFKDLGRNVIPIAINDNGDMLTSSALYDSVGTLLIDLAPLIGTKGKAKAVNNARHIVGYFERPDFRTHAFLHANGVFTDIGEGTANDINESDDVVGNPYGNAFPEDRIVFLWSKGVRSDLNRLISGVALEEAVAINDRGQIAANWLTQVTFLPDDHVRAVLLTPN